MSEKTKTKEPKNKRNNHHLELRKVFVLFPCAKIIFISGKLNIAGKYIKIIKTIPFYTSISEIISIKKLVIRVENPFQRKRIVDFPNTNREKRKPNQEKI